MICGTLEKMRMALFDRVLCSFGLSWSDGSKTHNSQCWLHVVEWTLVYFLHLVCFASILETSLFSPSRSIRLTARTALPTTLSGRACIGLLCGFRYRSRGLAVSFWMFPVVPECCARFLCCDCSKLCCLVLGISGSAVWAMNQ